MEINWSKTKIQAVGTQHYRSVVYIYIAGNQVEVGLVDHFTYLGVQISNDGSSEQEVRRRIARECFQALQNNIWRSSFRLETKIRLLNVYVFPVVLYGAETWSLTSVLVNACQHV